MNIETEFGSKETVESHPSADTSDFKSSPCVCHPGASASSAINASCPDSHENGVDNMEGLSKGGANQQARNEASSSELSLPSEMLTGANGENLPTTDSDYRTSPVDNSWGKTSRQRSRKRKVKPLIPGHTKDWESNDSWTSEKAQEDCTVVAEEIETKRRKIKSLQQKNRRLKVRHSRLKAAIREMKANMADRN